MIEKIAKTIDGIAIFRRSLVSVKVGRGREFELLGARRMGWAIDGLECIESAGRMIESAPSAWPEVPNVPCGDELARVSFERSTGTVVVLGTELFVEISREIALDGGLVVSTLTTIAGRQ
jgi:hypothetical protein